jgi:hypothetical protein
MFVAIPFDLLRKRSAMLKDVNVGYGKKKMDKMVRRREFPCLRRSRPLYKGQIVGDAVPIPMPME